LNQGVVLSTIQEVYGSGVFMGMTISNLELE
jgi:hypothetical protein